jgi:hypothetical protein
MADMFMMGISILGPLSLLGLVIFVVISQK